MHPRDWKVTVTSLKQERRWSEDLRMSIVDENGKPVAYGWNDEAAWERGKRDKSLHLIPDNEFEARFPELFPTLSEPRERAKR